MDDESRRDDARDARLSDEVDVEDEDVFEIVREIVGAKGDVEYETVIGADVKPYDDVDEFEYCESRESERDMATDTIAGVMCDECMLSML